MLIQKIQISIAFIILGAFLVNSGASVNLRGLDSIGRLPEINVTAPRYEYQDEAWLGMIEGVVVEAQRPLNTRSKDAIEEKSAFVYYGDSVYMLVTFTLLLVTLSVLYMSYGRYLAAKEVKNGRTKH
ncbi:hypothetical protein AMJ83_08560 [candidate division WOR_3 bacterium SM23_42]|uniref:Uncharacterized protein n=1 Tax=candidate division WOR_3 bacterium SM23_42 TaxID=1703779 RepID=A0A0S8FT19_UNCW3|nr:MAG: hypothetical protein AMJ83_08560 [candidate division WOR_3 bacterium SM23_42]